MGVTGNMKTLLSHYRLYGSLAVLFGLGLFIFGYVLEFVYYFAPCILCYVQRYLFLSTAIFAAPFAFGIVKNKVSIYIFLVISYLLSLAGLALSFKHLAIQKNPIAASCNAAVQQLLDSHNILSIFATWLQGNEECAMVQTWLGINIVYWSMAGFIIMLALLIKSGVCFYYRDKN